jgi:hypothetical protein
LSQNPFTLPAQQLPSRPLQLGCKTLALKGVGKRFFKIFLTWTLERITSRPFERGLVVLEENGKEKFLKPLYTDAESSSFTSPSAKGF